jgi:uncharacterized protein YggE
VATILVRGRAAADVPPDRVRLQLAVRAEAAAAADALAALAARSAALDTGLRRVDLLLRRPSAVTLGPVWSPQGEVTGQAARRAVTVEAAAGGPLGELLAVVAQVPGGSVDGVDWLVDPANPAHARLRAEAARVRAADYAAAAGLQLGAVEHLAEPGLTGPGPAARGLAFAEKAGGPGDGPVLELRPEPVPVEAEIDVRYAVLPG